MTQGYNSFAKQQLQSPCTCQHDMHPCNHAQGLITAAIQSLAHWQLLLLLFQLHDQGASRLMPHLQTGTPLARSSLGLTATAACCSTAGLAANRYGRQSCIAAWNASLADSGTTYHTCIITTQQVQEVRHVVEPLSTAGLCSKAIDSASCPSLINSTRLQAYYCAASILLCCKQTATTNAVPAAAAQQCLLPWVLLSASS